MSSAGSAFNCSLPAGREGGERAAAAASEAGRGGRRAPCTKAGAPGVPGEGDERPAAPAQAPAPAAAACAPGAGGEAGRGPCALSSGLAAALGRGGARSSPRPGRRKPPPAVRRARPPGALRVRPSANFPKNAPTPGLQLPPRQRGAALGTRLEDAPWSRRGASLHLPGSSGAPERAVGAADVCPSLPEPRTSPSPRSSLSRAGARAWFMELGPQRRPGGGRRRGCAHPEPGP